MSRTVINLDDDLIRQIRKLTGLKSKVEIVNKALEEFVQLPIDQIRWLLESRTQQKGHAGKGLR